MQDKKNPQFNAKIFFSTRRNLAVAIGLFVTSALLVVFAIIPQIQQSLELNQELAQEKPRLDKLKQKLVELQNIQFTPEFAQAEIVNSALPSKKPLLELLTSLNTIAVTNSVTIEDFSLNPGLIATDAAGLQAALTQRKSATAVDTLDVEMNVLGTFANVGKFIIDLEKISPFTTINKLSLSSIQSGDDFTGEQKDMRVQLVTKSYFFTQTVSASIEAPLPELSQKEQAVLQDLTQFSKNDLPEQIEITGGGLEDLFGVDALLFE